MSHPRHSGSLGAARALLAVVSMFSLSTSASALPNDFQVEPILTGVPLPVNMAFASDGRIFFNELRTGRIRIIKDGVLRQQPFYNLSVFGNRERGLIGIALAPGFPTDPWVYVYRTARLEQPTEHAENRLERIRADGDTGVEIQTLLVLPTSNSGIHNGGEMTFGPDNKLYLFVGEADIASEAQDLGFLGGKVLRLEPDGTGVADNPFAEADPNSIRRRIWSRGHRNSIGLAFNPVTGGLYETENGPNVADEINRILRGANYGWPDCTGPCAPPQGGLTNPLKTYTPTIALTGLAFMSARRFPPAYAGDLIFGDYNLGRLRRIDFDPNQVDKILAVNDTFFELDDLIPPKYPDNAALGVLDVQTGPDGLVWFTVGDFASRPPSSPVSPLGGIYRLRHRTFHSPDAPASPGPAGYAILGGVALCLVARRRRRFGTGIVESATRVGSSSTVPGDL